MDQARLVRIRLLSRHFHELRGLRVAFAGMIYTVVFGSYLLVTLVRESREAAAAAAEVHSPHA